MEFAVAELAAVVEEKARALNGARRRGGGEGEGSMVDRSLRRRSSPPWGQKSERPSLRYGHAGLAKRGKDLFLIKPDCFRIPGNPSTALSVFAIFDGHNGVSAAVFTKEYLLDHVMSAILLGIRRDEWLQELPRALVAGFVKTDIDFQRKVVGEASGTTVTFVVIDWASVISGFATIFNIESG